MSYLGHVEDGKIVLDTSIPLADGTPVRIEAIVRPVEQVIPPSTAAPESFLERYREFIGVADDLPTDLADQHDHYLYGVPKK